MSKSILKVDLTLGYRLLLRHLERSVRRVPSACCATKRTFPQAFDAFAARWGGSTIRRD